MPCPFSFPLLPSLEPLHCFDHDEPQQQHLDAVRTTHRQPVCRPEDSKLSNQTPDLVYTIHRPRPTREEGIKPICFPFPLDHAPGPNSILGLACLVESLSACLLLLPLLPLTPLSTARLVTRSRCLHRLCTCTKKAGHETAATACFCHSPASPVSPVLPVSPAPSLPAQTSGKVSIGATCLCFRKAAGIVESVPDRRNPAEIKEERKVCVVPNARYPTPTYRGSHSALLLSLKGLDSQRGPNKQTSPRHSKPYQIHTCSYTLTHTTCAHPGLDQETEADEEERGRKKKKHLKLITSSTLTSLFFLSCHEREC